MPQSILIVVFSLLFVIFVGLAFLFIYFRSQLQEVQEAWMLVLRKLRLRLDKIPNLVETVRRYPLEQKAPLGDMIGLRAKLWPLQKADAARVHAELKVSGTLHHLWELATTSPELAKDVNFLALKMEMREVHAQIENFSTLYNDKVRHFNRQTGFFLWRPVVRLLGFGRLPIFEFEG